MLQIRFLFLKKKIINIFTNFYRSLSLEKEITAQIKLQIHKYLSLQSPQNPITSHQSLAKSPPEWKKKKKEKKIKVAGFLKQNPPQTIPQTKNKLYHRVPSQRKRSMSKKHPSKRASTWPYPRKLAKSLVDPLKSNPDVYVPLHTCPSRGEGGGWPNVIGAPISDSRESICN